MPLTPSSLQTSKIQEISHVDSITLYSPLADDLEIVFASLSSKIV